MSRATGWGRKPFGLNPTLVPSCPVELDRSHSLAGGVTGLWLPGVRPQNLGTAGKVLSAGNLTPTYGTNPLGPYISATGGQGDVTAATGLYASQLGFGGSRPLTAFGHVLWNHGNAGFVFGNYNGGANQSLTFGPNHWNDFLVSFWGDDITFYNVKVDVTSVLFSYVFTVSGLNANLYSRAFAVAGPGVGTTTYYSGSITKTVAPNFADNVPMAIAGLNGMGCNLVGVASGPVWTAAQANQFINEPYAMLRPIVRRKLYLVSSGSVTITAGPGTAHASGSAGGVAAGAATSPGSGAVYASGLSASVSAGSAIAPGVGSVIASGRSAGASAGVLIGAGSGAVYAAGSVGGFAAGAYVLPGAGAIYAAGAMSVVSTGVVSASVSPGPGWIYAAGAQGVVTASAAFTPSPARTVSGVATSRMIAGYSVSRLI